MSAADVYARARAWMAAQPAPGPAPATVAAPGSVGPAASGGYLSLAAQVAASLCRRFEGLYLQPYLCPAGVPTIGYGATYYLDGRRVRLDDPAITRAQADALLLRQVRSVYMPGVLRLCPGVTDADRLAALIDFAFNLGAGNLSGSTLRKRVNAGRWDDVPVELRKWVRGGGRVLRGLVLRREAEVGLVCGRASA